MKLDFYHLEYLDDIHCNNEDNYQNAVNCKNPLYLVEQFIFLGSNISSTKSDVNIGRGKRGLLLKVFRNHENQINYN